MENISKEIKSIIFHQYYGQYVNSDKGRCRLCDSDFIDSLTWIELKPVSSITNDDAGNIAMLSGCSIIGKAVSMGKEIANMTYKNNYLFVNYRVFQYLQSKGYALPYMQYSVVDLVTAGIYLLEEK